jgi:glutamate racemase
MNTAPIGILDSGSGGLSVLSAIRSLLPFESCIYIGDHAYSPYGEKSTDVIRQRVVKLIGALVARGCKLIVIACNTATVAGIEYFRSQFPDVPIVGVVPVIKTAARLTKLRSFVVLSTNFTAESEYQKTLVNEWAADCVVTSLGSAALVPFIEAGKTSGIEINNELRRVFSGVALGSYDVVVLGCTHYPFVRSAIADVVGPNAQIIDSADAVARHVSRILEARDAKASHASAEHQFMTTGERGTVEPLFRKLMQESIEVTHVEV